MDKQLKVIDEEKVEDPQEEEPVKLTEEELFMKSYRQETRDNIMSKKNYIQRLENQVKKCRFEIGILKEMKTNKDIMKQLYTEMNGCNTKIEYNNRLVRFYVEVLNYVDGKNP